MATYICIVSYQVATYSGEITIFCGENDEKDLIIAKARAQLKRQCGGELPFGYERFTIISREEYFGV